MKILNNYATKIAFTYAIVGVCWIFLSDNMILFITNDASILTEISLWKGVSFVLVSAFAIRLVGLRRKDEEVKDSTFSTTGNTSLIVIFTISSFFIILIGIIGAAYMSNNEKQKAIIQLKTIADLKSNELQRWLEERKDDVEFLRSATFFVKPQGDWKSGIDIDRDTKNKITDRLKDLKHKANYQDVFLTDKNGNLILSSNKDKTIITQKLKEAIKLSLEKDGTVFTDIYRPENYPDKSIIDFVTTTKSPKGTPKLLVVARVEAKYFLYPFIQSSPILTKTAETLLFEKNGNNILFLNELRHKKNTALSMQFSINTPNLLAAKVLKAETAPDQPIDGVDYRNIPVIGIAHKIADTPWILVSKQDRSEIYKEAKRITLWIGIADTLTIIIVAGLMLVFHQRRELHFSGIRYKEQLEKLQALQLLESIAESSTEAIFAKDTNGKYILSNRQACIYIGRQKNEVIGHDDNELFPPKDAAKIISTDKEVMTTGHTFTYDEELETATGRKTFMTTKGPLIGINQAAIGVFGVSRDISERKATEERINELNRTLEEKVEDGIAKNREKDAILIQQSRLVVMGEMLSVIAHHWRQPLNALGIIIQDVKEAKKFGELNEDYIENMIFTSMNQINFMSKTIDDFRNFFLPKQEGKTFLLRDAIDNVIKLLSPELEANNIQVSIECDKNINKCDTCDMRSICGYQNELSQVILNTLINAKDAIAQRLAKDSNTRQGYIWISFSHPQESKSVVITIRDNGGGIKEEVLPRIFDPYFTTKAQGQGVGIGLYMSKVIIERGFGGKISAKNNDEGAELIIELPFSALAEA